MRAYGLKKYGQFKNSHYPHGPSCSICREMMSAKKHRSQKKTARRWKIEY